MYFFILNAVILRGGSTLGRGTLLPDSLIHLLPPD